MGANIQHVRNFTDWAFWEKKQVGRMGLLAGYLDMFCLMTLTIDKKIC